MTNIKTIKLNDEYSFELQYDDICSCLYDESFDSVTLISTHRSYANKGPNKHLKIGNLLNDENELVENYGKFEVVPVYAYDHGGITLSLQQFGCRFDSGLFGALLFEKGEFGEDNRGLKGFIKSLNCLLSGEVYGFSIIKHTKCDCCNHIESEVIDSCGGFYGYDNMQSMFDEMKSYIDLPSELTDKIKEQGIT